MQAANFDETIEKILQRDRRYHRPAYHFVRESLDHTHKMMGKSDRDAIHHVTGQELLGGIRAHALEQFGPMTLTVLHEWGVRRCEDFGEIVFNMVESGLLAKTDNDSRDAFTGGYDFEEAFRRPFLPTRKISFLEPEPRQV